MVGVGVGGRSGGSGNGKERERREGSRERGRRQPQSFTDGREPGGWGLKEQRREVEGAHALVPRSKGPLPMALVCAGKYRVRCVLSRRAGVGQSGRPGRTQSWRPQQKVSAGKPQRAQVPCRWRSVISLLRVKPVGLAEWFPLAALSWHPGGRRLGFGQVCTGG